jgi:hypothetical protein
MGQSLTSLRAARRIFAAQLASMVGVQNETASGSPLRYVFADRAVNPFWANRGRHAL